MVIIIVVIIISNVLVFFISAYALRGRALRLTIVLSTVPVTPYCVHSEEASIMQCSYSIAPRIPTGREEGRGKREEGRGKREEVSGKR